MLKTKRHLFKRIIFRLLSDLNRWAQPLDNKVLEEYALKKKIKPPPVFIVGAPRTGSTIIYQIITHYYDVDYISNFSALFYHSLYIGKSIEKILLKNKIHKSFSSIEGLTKGWRSPHECGQFWYRWFPKDRHFMSIKEFDYKKYLRIRKTISAIADLNNKPLIIKNLNNGQRLQVIKKILPESLIIFCKRDPVYSSQSILISRQNIYQDKKKWLSVMPKNYDELKKLPYIEQIVKQVYYIEKQIEQDIKLFPNVQTISFNYETFCENTQEQLNSLNEFFKANRINIRKRLNSFAPRCRVRNSINIEVNEFKSIESWIKKLYHN